MAIQVNLFWSLLLRFVVVVSLLLTSLQSLGDAADNHGYAGKKILYINSFHAGYAWSDGIERGIRSRFLIEDVWFKTHYMDTKRRRSPDNIDAAVVLARKVIDEMRPDVVIMSDDVAVKYVLEPYYKNDTLPFVYVGVAWDSSVYGLPYQNTTGMIEVSLIGSLVDLLSQYASGERIGFLSIDALSGVRMLEHYERVLGLKFDQVYFANSAEEWEQQFLALQRQVDFMILESPEGIKGWTAARELPFVEREVRIPIGTSHKWLAPYSLITIAKIPEEQGWWAAEQALKILDGVKPEDIPETQNMQGELFANMEVAERLGVVFSAEILQAATLINVKPRILMEQKPEE